MKRKFGKNRENRKSSFFLKLLPYIFHDEYNFPKWFLSQREHINIPFSQHFDAMKLNSFSSSFTFSTFNLITLLHSSGLLSIVSKQHFSHHGVHKNK